MRLYEHDCRLPQLPVPALEETAQELKKRVEPIVSPEDYAAFCSELARFISPEGEGPRLQQLLLDWQKALPSNSSWLRSFWDDSYIAYQDSLPKNLHYTLQLRSDRWSPDALPRFTSAFARSLLHMREETLPPESGKDTLSMDSMGRMIYTRIPAPVRDLWYYPRLTDPLTAAVCCRGHWFILSLMDKHGQILPPSTLSKAYESIRAQAAALPDAAGVGAFTCAARDTALSVRSELSQFLLNRLSLESIEKAVFTVCLDEPGAEEVPFGKSVLAGPAKNRWFDKAFQLISSGERLGASLEHSGCDGIMWAYFFGQVDEELLNPTDLYADEDSTADIRLLDWLVPEPLAARLDDIATEFSVWQNSMSFDQRRMKSLSKVNLKRLRCSPDAAVQLLYQAAYHRLTGKQRSVYEAVSVRNFYGGRTECIRSCTMESARFLSALSQHESPAAILDAFRAAGNVHVENISRCKEGLGCERHMAGLQNIHQMYSPALPLPPLFHTEAFRQLKHDTLSTSSIPGTAVDYFAFVPVVQDGLGIGYALYQDALHVATSSYSESGVNPSDFLAAMEQIGQELLSYCED